MSTIDVTARAPGVWVQAITCPTPTPLPAVQRTLHRFARVTSWPVNAVAFGLDQDGSGLVTELLLTRDPSRTYGTPGVPVCAQAAAFLCDSTGWEHRFGTEASTADLVVPLGLRVGYGPDAPVHTVEQARAVLPGMSVRAGWIVTARWTGTRLYRHDEPAVLVCAANTQQHGLVQGARQLGQQRVCLTDRGAGRTLALALTGGRREPSTTIE